MDYPLIIHSRKKINITVEQFDKLSFMGVASLFCSYPAAIAALKTEYLVYMTEGNSFRFRDKKIFNDIKCGIYKEAEIAVFHIPFNHKLIKTINKQFSHLIMGND